jgi:HlyD family secretion protein
MRNRPTRWRRNLWLIGKIAAGLLAIGAVVYWFKFAPVNVTRHPVKRGEIIAEVMGTGTLEAHVKATISPKISGLITKVLVDQGDPVKAGQVLVQLDDSDLKRQVEIAQAGVAASTAGLNRLRADKARAAAVVEQARRYRDRLEGVTVKGSVSEADIDKASEALDVAKADLTRSEAGITEGEKQLAAAEQNLEYHRARLSDTVIKAPFDGLVVRRDRDPGDVVVPGGSVLGVISTAEIWVSAWVDETEMARLKPGLPARVVFRSEPHRSYKGEVARLGREADRETREFVVDVLVRTLPTNWAVGQRAEVYIETARKNDVTLLPAKLVIWRDAKVGTFVADAGRAKWRPLTLGLRSREAVEVVDGLKPGETVVSPADPQDGALTDGRRVKVQ